MRIGAFSLSDVPESLLEIRGKVRVLPKACWKCGEGFGCSRFIYEGVHCPIGCSRFTYDGCRTLSDIPALYVKGALH